MRVTTPTEVRVLPDDLAAEPAWKKLTRQGWFMAVASPVLLLLVWETLVRVGLLDSRFFPMPSVVIRDLVVQAATLDLWRHTGYTISRMLMGFMLGAIPGVLVGIAMGLSPMLRQLLQPAISSIYPIPKVALFPLVMLMFGLGETSKWVIVAVAVFFQVLMATLAGVVNIDRVYLDVAADFRARRWQAYRTIALPAALPFIFTGFQLGLGMSLIVVVIAENFGTEKGLGYVIWHSWQIFEVRDMYVALILVALLGYLSQLLLARIERAVIPWRRPMRQTVGTYVAVTTQTWRVGAATITRVEEQVGPNDSTAGYFLPDLDRARFDPHLPWLAPTHYDPVNDKLITSNHSWLLRTEGRTILVDTCAGNHKERPWLPRFHQLDVPFMERLEAAGAKPEDIDIVLCTHLHADHVGWNTRLENGKWVPTFPNARYLFSRIENDAWNPEIDDRRQKNPGRAGMYDDSVLPVIQSGQAQLLDGAHEIAGSLLVEPTPGHTPGHVILKLQEEGGGAVFCGDTIHHPVQVCEPDWSTRFCEDPVQARVSRRKVLEHCAESRSLLFPTHFAAPHVAAIEREGEGRYRPRFVHCCDGP